MSALTDDFIKLLANDEDAPYPEDAVKAFNLVASAPDSPERTGLLAYIYHEGLGVRQDLDKSFELAEKAAFEGRDSLGYFLLGYMCDNFETPDQAAGGPRQKYDHYDAERFYAICADMPGRWRDSARLWLGDYYLDSARGGDPEIGIEYLESIAEENSQAAAALSDYYFQLCEDFGCREAETLTALLHWTDVAAEFALDGYRGRLRKLKRKYGKLLDQR